MKMRKCTDPERWKVAPGWEASEDEVEAYLSHARECSFHGEFEEHRSQMIGTIAAIAGRTLNDGRPALTPEIIAGLKADLNRKRDANRQAPTKVSSAFKPAVAFLMAIVVCSLAVTQLFRTWQPAEMNKPEGQAQQSNKPEPSPALSGQQADQNRQDSNNKPSDLAKQGSIQSSQHLVKERKSKNIAANKNATAESSSRYPQRIYLDHGFDPKLRQALNEGLHMRGFTVVKSKDQAVAMLRVEQTRSEEVIVELQNNFHERLWWMNIKLSNDGSVRAEDLAKKIADDLFNKIESLKPVSGTPSRR